MPNENRCAICQELSEYVYCAKCAGDARCPHGKKPEDCDSCALAGDIAYDEQKGRT